MKNILLTISLFISLVLVSGCATVAKGPNFTEAKAVAPKPGLSTLYVFREHAEPTAWGADIQVNAKTIATLNQNGFTWIHIKPGKKEIKAVWAGMSGQKDSYITIDVKEGKTHYVELTGISKVTGGSFPLMYFKMGSGLNELMPNSAVKRLETCCKFQKPIASSD